MCHWQETSIGEESPRRAVAVRASRRIATSFVHASQDVACPRNFSFSVWTNEALSQMSRCVFKSHEGPEEKAPAM